MSSHNSTDSSQYQLFKDCIAQRVLAQPEQASSDASELDDFSSYLADESWPSLPAPLREATYETRAAVPNVAKLPLHATPLSFIDSLVSYEIVPDADDAIKLLRKVLEQFVREACAAPPPWSATRTTECEICEREVPLTYHHLIPRSTHTKVLKKKWHPPEMLNSVAWLCRPCHSAVHSVESNEVLAQSYHTLELLLEREDIQRWRKYAAKQRWGTRRG